MGLTLGVALHKLLVCPEATTVVAPMGGGSLLSALDWRYVPINRKADGNCNAGNNKKNNSWEDNLRGSASGSLGSVGGQH